MPIIKTVWRTFSADYADWASRLIGLDSSGKIYSDDFLKRLSEQHEKLQSRNFKLLAFNISLMVALLLAVMFQNDNFQFLGVSTEGLYKIKELILFVAATIGLLSSMNSAHIEQIKIIERAYSRTKHGAENAMLLDRALPVFLDFPTLWIFIEGNLILPKTIVEILKRLLPIIFLFLLLFYIVASIGVHVYVLSETIAKSEMPEVFLWFVVIYVVLADLFTVMLLMTISFPLPYTDYRMNAILADLQKTDAIAYRSRLAEIGLEMAIEEECRKYARTLLNGLVFLIIMGMLIG